MISMVRSENEPVILALGFRLEAIRVVVTENSETELSLSVFQMQMTVSRFQVQRH